MVAPTLLASTGSSLRACYRRLPTPSRGAGARCVRRDRTAVLNQWIGLHEITVAADTDDLPA